jgi:hypothetical protein
LAASWAAAELPADALALLEPLPEDDELHEPLPDEPVVPPLEELELLPEELLPLVPLVLLLLPAAATLVEDAAEAPVALSTAPLPQALKARQIVAAAASSSWEEPRCGIWGGARH